jgi:hypothetical protein
MPRPMQHPRQAPRGTACNVACRTLLPPSTSRKHVPVTAGAGSAPLASAYRVLPSPSGPAAAFIFAANAACEPASQRASREAMLLPEG